MGTWNATCSVTQLPLILKPQDPLARDTISGSGSSNADTIAQPLSLPLRGVYNGSGGIDRADNECGQTFLEAALQGYVGEKRLYKLVSAEPVQCKTLPKDFLQQLVQGDLLVMTPNPRKAWLTELHKQYKKSKNKDGMSHYLPQLKVKPEDLPDHLVMPLALTLVPTTLYEALAQNIGRGESYDRWDDKTNKTIEFNGTRQEQLQADLTMSPDHRHKFDMMLAAVEEDLASRDGVAPNLKERDAMRNTLRTVMAQGNSPAATEGARALYFAPKGVLAAMEAAIVDDNADVREELIKFSLFSSAFVKMRKQWTPQTGAGSSSGLEESTTRELYEITGQFIASSCDLSSDKTFAPR